MKFAAENLFRFADPTAWRCTVVNMSDDGRATIRVQPIPASRSRLNLVLRDVIYQDNHGEWMGCNLNEAHQDQLKSYLPKLGRSLRKYLGDEKILSDYKLYVFRIEGANDAIFIAKDARIAEIQP